MTDEQMQKLLEIQAKIKEITNLSFDIKVHQEVLKSYTDILKAELIDTLSDDVKANLSSQLKDALKEPLKNELKDFKKRIFTNITTQNQIYYQEVKENDDGKIIFYGDIFVQGKGAYSGSLTSDSATFRRVLLPNDIEFIDLVGGGLSFCALPKEGNFIYVWGYNYYGECGVGNTAVITKPVRVDLPARPVKLLHGLDTSYASNFIILCDNGKVLVSGYNNSGTLGLGNTINSSVFVENPYLENIVDIAFSSVSGAHGMCMALKDDNTLFTWGYNPQGACGNNTTSNVLIPYKHIFSKKIVQIACNCIYNTSSNAFIVFDDGTIRGAGYNKENQLSQLNMVDSSSFIELRDNEQILTNIKKVFPASKNGACFALSYDDELLTWGNLAQGNGLNITGTLQAHKILDSVDDIIYDSYNTKCIARLKDGSFKGFGYNTNANLGCGTSVNEPNWVDIAVPKGVKQFAYYQNGTAGHFVVCDGKDVYASGLATNGAMKVASPVLQPQCNI